MGVGSSSVTAGQARGTDGEGVGGCCVLGLGWALDADAEGVAVVDVECLECWRR